MAAPVVFELRDVSTGPPDEPVLRAVTAAVPCLGITGVAGPSGAGKTSLLRLLNRLDDPRTGRVDRNGRDLAEVDPHRLRREVGMIFQRPAVFPGSVNDNLLVPDPSIGRDDAAAVLARVGLDDRLLDRDASALSGGEAQRMSIARALVTGPKVLLADEPTASLDADSRATIEELGRNLAASGVPIVWVTHDIDQLRSIADNVVVVVGGRVEFVGTLDEVVTHPDARVRRWVGA